MRAFFAIVKLTLRDALRSHIFQLLLGLLVVSAIALPTTVSGAGDGMRAYIQVALKYSLGAVGFILVLSTVWLSSLVMTQDVESYQLHMVVAKPVSRIKIFLAKYFSVVLLHAILLALAGIAIYLGVMWRFSQDDPSMDKTKLEQERERIRNEVLVGRRVYTAEMPDMEKLAKEALEQQLEDIRKSGRTVSGNAADEEKAIRESMSEDMLRQRAEIMHGKKREWVFRNLPKDLKDPIYLRYRSYVGKIDSEAQRDTVGEWRIFFVRLKDGVDPNGTVGEDDYIRSWERLGPEMSYAGEFHEKVFKGTIVDPEGNVSISYTNLDPQKDKVYFQTVDGPKLLIKVTGFAGNFIRGLLVMLLMLIVYAGISCAAAAALSMPTTIFVVLSYMFLGGIAPLIMTTSQLRDASQYAGYWIGKVLEYIMAPLQKFEISQKIAGGELVEFSFIGELFTLHFMIQTLPIIALGIYLYWRRELGLVIRK